MRDNAAPVARWLSGTLGDRIAQQIERITWLPDVVRVAVMPDVHEGLSVPNGVVVATRRLIFPDLVGADIGCGLAALRFEAQVGDLSSDQLRKILYLLGAHVPTIKQPAPRANQHLSAIEALGTLSCHELCTRGVARRAIPAGHTRARKPFPRACW